MEKELANSTTQQAAIANLVSNEERGKRGTYLFSMDYYLWAPPWPCDAQGLLLCENSEHYGSDDPNWPQFYWIAIRLTEDREAFELVRIDGNARIVEEYKGRFIEYEQALLAAATLRKIWNKAATDTQQAALSEERDLTRNLKLNPWGRAVWERKDPEGPVLVVWHLEPLPLYVASWLPFAGARCVPSLVSFMYESDPSRVNAAVDALAEEAYAIGPSKKMIDRSKSISASYAANGRKGGRSKKSDMKRSEGNV